MSSEEDQKEPLLRKDSASSSSSSTPRPPPPPPPPPPPRPPQQRQGPPPHESLSLDVERAETSNLRSLEEQQQQQQQQSNNLLNRATDSFLRLYDHVNFAGSGGTSPSPRAAPREAAASHSPSAGSAPPLPPRGPSSPPRPAAQRRGTPPTTAPDPRRIPKASLSRAASDTTTLTSNRSHPLAAAPTRPALDGSSPGRKPPSFKNLARHVQLAKSISERRMSLDRTGQARELPAAHLRRGLHRKQQPSGNTAAEILHAIQDDECENDDEYAASASDFDGGLTSPVLPRKVGLRETVHRIEPLLGVGGGVSSAVPLFGDDSLEEWEYDHDEQKKEESRPVGGAAAATTPLAAQYGSLPLGGSSTVASTSQGDLDDEDDSSLEFLSHRFSLTRRLRRRSWRKHMRRFRYCCRPDLLWSQLREALRHSLLWVAIPLFVVAWFLYYTFGNPELDFLPGSAKVSWWCNFVGRQLLTLELARFSTWIFLDGMVMTRWGARLLGGYITFFCLQGAGWPLVLTSWGIWDLLLLHGNNRFQSHWLYWTGWRIYSIANSGRYILESVFYLRLLVSLILLGLATATKRTVLAIRFGNRQLADFKPRLEKILQDAVIVSEVAVVAQEAALLVREEDMCDQALDVLKKAGIPRTPSATKALPRIRFGSVTFESQDETIGASTSHDSDEDDGHRHVHEGKVVDTPPTDERASAVTNMSPSTVDPEPDAQEEASPADAGELPSPVPAPRARPPALARTESGSFGIKEMLDRWEEPPTKTVKSASTSIRDILKFQRVLRSIDATFPFGEEFGPCATRNDCIDSAHSVYWRLMSLTPDAMALSFDTIALGALDEEGNVDEAKFNAFKRVFRPDACNELTMTAFIQSIDTVYKHLLFFRASVRNNSVIDHVLESIVNGVFYFVMTLILLSFMQINPWPLLVSLTSLLVSVSFALGSSVSKYVEGLLLIAVRRPFDLGDRIIILPPEAADNPGPSISWFVEDINLFSTTLRFARTNEVATVSNSSISASRIVNCNRSPKAIVFFDILTKSCILDGEKMAKFLAALTKYVADSPRTWECMLFCRKDTVDADLEQVKFSLGFRHRNSWQDAARILLNRGDLIAHVYGVIRDLGVAYDTPPNRRLLYYGGVLVSGQVQDYKSNLLSPRNIRSHSSRDLSPQQFEMLHHDAAVGPAAFEHPLEPLQG